MGKSTTSSELGPRASQNICRTGRTRDGNMDDEALKVRVSWFRRLCPTCSIPAADGVDENDGHRIDGNDITKNMSINLHSGRV